MAEPGTCDPRGGTLDEVIDRAQVLTRRLLSDKPDATVDAFLVRSYILCDLAIRTAMRISHIALPCLVRPRALCSAPTREQHYEKQGTQTRQCSLWISCHCIPP